MGLGIVIIGWVLVGAMLGAVAGTVVGLLVGLWRGRTAELKAGAATAVVAAPLPAAMLLASLLWGNVTGTGESEWSDEFGAEAPDGVSSVTIEKSITNEVYRKRFSFQATRDAVEQVAKQHGFQQVEALQPEPGKSVSFFWRTTLGFSAACPLYQAYRAPGYFQARGRRHAFEDVGMDYCPTTREAHIYIEGRD